jgi:hypothetical protein
MTDHRIKGEEDEHQVEIPSKLNAGIDLLLFLRSYCNSFATLLPRLCAFAWCPLRSTRDGNGLLLLVRMAVIMTMSLPTSCDPQSLIHSNKRHETNHDGHSQEQVPVRLHEHESNVFWGRLAKENLGQQVEECITQQSSYSKCDHDRQ